MTIWDDQFEAHAVFPALEQAGRALDASEEHLADAAQTEAQARLRRVLEHTRETLGTVDPELASRQALDAIASNVSSVVTYLEQFASSPQQASLDNANTHADAILVQLPALMPPRTTKDVEGLQGAVSSFRRSIGQHARHADTELEVVQTKAQELVTRLTAQEQKVEAQDARIDSVLTQFQAQFSDEQSQRSTQFGEVLERSRGQAAETVEALKTDIEEAVKEAQAKATESVDATKQTTDEELKQLRDEVAKRLEELNELRAKAELAVGATGSAVLAGGYQKAAKSERRAAALWQLATVLSFIGATLVAVYAVRHGLSTGLDFQRFGAKVTIGLPIIALAYYAARESSKHREQAQLNRQLELQLSSLDAYLRELPEPQRQEIKGELAERFFESGTRGVAAAERAVSGRRVPQREPEAEEE